MYLSNKYTKWYYAIIDNAKQRSITTYTETHHIIPKSLGGSNEKDNLVVLTAREHFVCHLLLTKMTVGNAQRKMIFAATAMMQLQNNRQTRHRVTNRLYQYIREQNSLARKGTKQTLESNQKNSDSHKGIRWSNGMTGKKHTNETKAKMSLIQKGKKHTEETKRKLSEMAKEQHADPLYVNPMFKKEVLDKHKSACLDRSSIKVECPHCNRMFSRNTYALWHGDNCKSR